MYTGRRVAEGKAKPKKRRYLRIFFLWSLLIILLMGATGYIYAMIFEGRIHSGLDFGKGKALPVAKEGGPVTFLIIGCDKRAKENDPGRSDTLMVLRMDPAKKVAYLISIPRDSRVEVPGHGMTKINAAYAYGGADLSADTVSNVLGLEINHYVVVDFQGFKDIVDALGGIDINVKKKIRDHFDGNYVSFNPGMHHFNGQEALEYVRVRHVDDDFGRMGRQQQFLRAVMDKLTRFSNIWKIPELAGIASRNIKTDPDLGFTQIVSYGEQIKSIGRKNIHMITLPALSTNEMIDGLSYVILNKPQMNWIFDRIKNNLPLQLTRKEKQNKNIRIDVQNGSGKPGMAQVMADKLASFNYKIAGIGNAKSFNYAETQIIVPVGKEDIGRKVQSELGLGNVSTGGVVSSSTDAVVIVGRDFAYMTNDTSNVNNKSGNQNY